MLNFKRITVIVIDSGGVGELPDAYKFNDVGTNTMLHVLEGRDKLPDTYISMGLGYLLWGKEPTMNTRYGKMAEMSPGKDTTTGHWEMMGLVLQKPFPTYPNGFPKEIIEEFEKRIGRKVLGNRPASGTVILDELGELHLKTGYPIVYTSADSVFQIAAHEELIPPEELYKICETAREILQGEHAVARVIARPFIGKKKGEFKRTANRRDFSLPPLGDTVLDYLKQAGYDVIGIGKIGDIFAHRGLTYETHTHNNAEGMEITIDFVKKKDWKGLLFTNLVDFDTLYGHRRNRDGYYQAIMEFDEYLKQLLPHLDEDDLLVITADHGCDPTHMLHTDHTREYVPIVAYSPAYTKPIHVGVRKTYADLGQTIAKNFGVGPMKYGEVIKEIFEK